MWSYCPVGLLSIWKLFLPFLKQNIQYYSVSKMVLSFGQSSLRWTQRNCPIQFKHSLVRHRNTCAMCRSAFAKTRKFDGIVMVLYFYIIAVFTNALLWFIRSILHPRPFLSSFRSVFPSVPWRLHAAPSCLGLWKWPVEGQLPHSPRTTELWKWENRLVWLLQCSFVRGDWRTFSRTRRRLSF